MISRIGLGTAQFGSDYGVTNTRGQPSKLECMKIVDAALEAGIEYYDTAAYYNEADKLLSYGLAGSDAKVISKVRNQRDVERSQTLFGRNLYALFSRGPVDGFTGKLGKSLYWQAPDEKVDIVQLPLSIADQRNLPLLLDYHAKGVEVHARSVFLQGLLLERGATIRQCLKFVLAQPIDVAIVGVNSADELKAIIEAVNTLDDEEDRPIPFIEPDRLDPRTWLNTSA